jgi:hypothetical protein
MCERIYDLSLAVTLTKKSAEHFYQEQSDIRLMNRRYIMTSGERNISPTNPQCILDLSKHEQIGKSHRHISQRLQFPTLFVTER